MTNTPQLKPCPFCGDPMEWRGGDYYYAAHTNFKSLCPVSLQGFTYPEKWNIRTPPKVKPLVWEKSYVTPWYGDYHTVPTAYTVRCADKNGYKWMCAGGHAYGWSDTPEAAQAAAQADYERRI